MDVVTLTFGDVAENGPGMQKLGKLADKGYSIDDLKRFKENFEEVGVECEFINLNEYLDVETEEAGGKVWKRMRK